MIHAQLTMRSNALEMDTKVDVLLPEQLCKALHNCRHKSHFDESIIYILLYSNH